MAFQVDQLPTENPFKAVEEGLYRAVIKKAEMTESKSTPGSMYLKVESTLYTQDGQASGALFDNFFDSEKQFPQFKLGRFIAALKLKLTSNSLELKSLAKMLPNKEYIVDIRPKQLDNGKIYAEVNSSNSDMYWPVSNAPEFKATAKAEPTPTQVAPVDETPDVVAPTAAVEDNDEDIF